MTPHEFSKMMKSPYFHTDHYRNESKEMQMQKQIESFFLKWALRASKLFTWPMALHRAYRKRKPF
jgi:hypothetical protein